MSLFNTIKADALSARKARHTEKATSLTTLIGELETFAKNAGRTPTDADAVAFVQKTLKNVNEVLRLIGRDGSQASDVALREKHLFEAYLPKQMTTVELEAAIQKAVDDGAETVGDVMKILKTRYNGQYDGATASALLKARFAK